MVRHPLFLGLVRPPMMWGVPQTYWVFEFIGCLASAMGSKAFLFFGGLFCILHLVGYLASLKEPRFFDLWLGSFDFLQPNRWVFRCQSYDPF